MFARMRPSLLSRSIAILAVATLPVVAEVNYSTQVRPIFQKKCLKCHGPKKSKSDYRLDSRTAALKGDGIIPGNPQASYLIELVEDGEMPPKGPPLSKTEISLLKSWIRDGAKWNGPAAKANPARRGTSNFPMTEHPGSEAMPPDGAPAPQLAQPIDLSALPSPLATDRQIDFATEVRPLLKRSCMKCHGPEKPKGRFRLDNRRSALRGGSGGLAIVPGNSAKSPMIHLIAHLVPDLEMPPSGDAPPMSPNEIALLRTWIDQGATWDADQASASGLTLITSPMIGGYSVNGNEQLFRQHHWTREGLSGGFAKLQLDQWLDDETRVTVEGRLDAPHNLDFTLNLERQDIGFVRGGFEHFRSYSNNVGGYYTPFATEFAPSFELDRNLHLDRGRIWTEIGIDRPRFPSITLGYEYRFKDGEKSTLYWGASTQDDLTRNILPSYKMIDEDVHRITLDLRHDWKGILFENNLLAEFYDSTTTRVETSRSNFAEGSDTLTTITESSDSSQFANAFSMQKLITDHWLLSGGYYYSKLDSDATFSQETLDSLGNGVSGQYWSAQPINLDWHTHIFNASTRLGPWKGWTFTTGLQNNWERQDAMGTANYFFGLPTPDVPPPSFFVSNVQSERKTVSMREHATLRYTGIRRAVFYAEGEWEQQDTELFEHDPGLINGFRRDTGTDSRDQDYTLGMTLNPLPRLSLNAHYRYSLEDDDYDHRIDEANGEFPNEGYSAFIVGRELETNEFKTHINYRPKPWLRTLLSYRHQSTDFTTETDSVPIGVPIGVPPDTPGGEILAGKYDANIYGLNIHLTPWEKLALSCNCSYYDTQTRTANNDDPAVTSYTGDVYAVNLGGTYRISGDTQLAAYYTYSRADYAHDNSASGLPLGIDYRMHGLQAALSTRITDNVHAQLQYRYHDYDEPSSKGVNDYTAHGIFLNCTVNWN